MAKLQKSDNTARCITCTNSYLMQRGSNPIIAECGGNRHVANALRKCTSYEKSRVEKPINQMKAL